MRKITTTVPRLGMCQSQHIRLPRRAPDPFAGAELSTAATIPTGTTELGAVA